jgi:hypothetical protein
MTKIGFARGAFFTLHDDVLAEPTCQVHFQVGFRQVAFAFQQSLAVYSVVEVEWREVKNVGI